MLKPKKSKWFEKIFSIYNRNLIKRRFNSLRVSGFEFLQNKKNGFPLITFANHSSWWDGLILFELFQHFDIENYVLMEEKQLKDLFLFRKLGAFSIVREEPKKALESIYYSAKLLRKSSKTNLLIFPQGKILPNDLRPLKFFNGISRIIEKCGNCQTVPIALRFEFINEFKPEAFIKIGKPKIFENISKGERKTLTNTLAKDLTVLLDELKVDILNQNFDSFKRFL